MERNLDSEAAIIINDLDSMIHRIEGLPAHPRYTDALVKVMDAKDAVTAGRKDIHRKDQERRFADVSAADSTKPRQD